MRTAVPARLTALAVAIALVAALAAYPLRHGVAYIDDYAFLSLGAHLDAPWVLLVQDSLGAFFFRPVGMFLWWLSVAAFGPAASPQTAVNLALHAANAFAAAMLARRLGMGFAAAAVAALLLVAHPAAFSTAAWLSDRFDLLATLFGLLALHEADRYLEKPGRARLALALAAALAAMLSKETAFAIPPAIAVLCSWRATTQQAARRDRVVLVAAAFGLAAAALAVRPLLLRMEALPMHDGLVATFAGGLWSWLQALPALLLVVHGNLVGIVAAGVGLATLLALPLVPRVRAALRGGPLPRAMLVACVLIAGAAATQTPIVHLTPPSEYRIGKFELLDLVTCRFYYLPMAGFAILAAALVDAFARGAGKRARPAALAVATAALAGMLATDRAIGREWAALAEATSTRYVRAAVEAVRGLDAKAPGCKIYFLGTPREASDFRLYADVAVKHALPRGHPAVACFLQAEAAPWFHLVRADAVGRERPLETITVRGKPFAPLRVGNMAYDYLDIPDSDAVRDDPAALFLAWDGQRFADVTPAVRSRARAVHFHSVRPPA